MLFRIDALTPKNEPRVYFVCEFNKDSVLDWLKKHNYTNIVIEQY